MTSGQTENAYWKKLQNDSSCIADGNNANVFHLPDHQPKQKINLNDLMSQNQMNVNNLNALQNLNEMLMQTNRMNATQASQPKANPIREVGVIEKVLNGYGFIKSVNRENGLFFHYNMSQNVFKGGDIVEFNEGVDKNGKLVATNLTKLNDNKMSHQSNLKDVLLNPQSQVQQNKEQQNFENFLNDLKQFNLKQQVEENQNLNNLLSLLNKENVFNQSESILSSNQQNNIFNMSKLACMSNLPSSTFSEFIEGVVSIPANHHNQMNAEGRLTYQRNGETFYIPYLTSDVLQANAIPLNSGDRVRFCIAQRNANNMVRFVATRIELANNPLLNTLKSQANQRFRGIISWVKDSFGKIEREDEPKETFFHFTDYKGEKPISDLRIGSNVEFEIQDRYGKEIAVNIKSLPSGSVSFDDLSRNIYIGRITSAPLMNSLGRLVYDNDGNLVELSFTDRDRVPEASEYSLLEGDFVLFRIATDKRKRLQHDKRATHLTLIEEYSLVENSINTNEHREKGVLAKILNDKYGAIKCLEHDDLVFFSFNQVVNFAKLIPDSVSYRVDKTNLELGDSLEFSLVQCHKDQMFANGLKAIRVVKLCNSSVHSQAKPSATYEGVIEKEASAHEFGTIKYEPSSQKLETIFYKLSEAESDEKKKSSKNVFKKGDRVQFSLTSCITSCIKTKQQFATNLKLAQQRKLTGYVTMLKDTYGFIELNLFDTAKKWPNDIFFHYSSYQDNINELNVGDQVEFTVNKKNKQKLSAENVCKASEPSEAPNKPLPGLLKGKVVQALRSHTNDQSNEYYGRIQVVPESSKKEQTYQFGLFSLADRKLVLKVGEIVSFQLIETPQDNKKAYNVLLVQQAPADLTDKQAKSKDAKKGKIESIKGHCGFIEFTSGYEAKKIFFHISDFIEPKNPDIAEIKIGDEVEFQSSHRNAKLSAVKIKRISSSTTSGVNPTETQTVQRPERLLTKLKAANIDDESGKQLILIRGPINPDGKKKSFSRQLQERLPGELVNENSECSSITACI